MGAAPPLITLLSLNLLWLSGCLSARGFEKGLQLTQTKTRGENFRRQVARVCERMQEELPRMPQPMPEIFLEGRLDADPQRVASKVAVKDFDIAFHSAACAASADNPQVAASGLERAWLFLDSWSSVYNPQGNPINDSQLLPLFLAAQLVWPQLSVSQQVKVSTWLREFVAQGDRFYAGSIAAGARPIVHPDSDGRVKNNWQTWRLAIRSSVVSLVGDTAERAKTMKIIADHMDQNLHPDGSSIDFWERDALHYHVYDLAAWTHIAMVAPSLLSEDQRSRIEQSFLFLKPFYEGVTQHVEFDKSRVKFDAERRLAGTPGFAREPWKPQQAKSLLRLARCFFPPIRPWTTELERSNEASPMTKFLAALYCEP